MAWPKGKPRPDAFKKGTPQPEVIVSLTDKFTCDCGNRMIETNHRDYPPGQAEYSCFVCGNKRIINFNESN